MSTRFQEHYQEKVVADLMTKFGYKSVMEVPRITKVTLNMGLGDAVNDKKIIENAVGDLNKVKRIVKVLGMVNSTETFTDQPKVINGASDLVASIFGNAGMHTRAAVSTNSLPLGVSVEVDAIFEIN